MRRSGHAGARTPSIHACVCRVYMLKVSTEESETAAWNVLQHIAMSCLRIFMWLLMLRRRRRRRRRNSRSRKPVFFPLCATLATQYVCICMWRPFCSALADVAVDICRYDMGCSMYFCSYSLCVEFSDAGGRPPHMISIACNWRADKFHYAELS